MAHREVALTGHAGLSLAATVSGTPTGALALFVHGAGQTRHTWRRCTQALDNRGIGSVAIDLRGHGNSQWPADGDYSLASLRADLLAVLARLDRPTVLVGASLGGLACLLATASTTTEQVPALVLVDIVPAYQRTGGERVLRFMSAHADGFATLDEAVSAIAQYLPHRAIRSSDGLRRNLRRTSDGRWRWHWDPQFAISAPTIRAAAAADLEAAQASLSRPVLLLTGRLSDVVRPEDAAAFVSGLPRAQHVALDGAAHSAATDDNDAFGSIVADYVAGILNPTVGPGATQST